MPWQKVDTMDLKLEFVNLARSRQISFSELCRRYKISRKTGYKWLNRYESKGEAGLEEDSRVPHNQPFRTASSIEKVVVKYSKQYQEWGPRKLARLMKNDGHRAIPSPSTITQIRRRHGVLPCDAERQENNFCRFEHPNPNDLWQMDYKGEFKTAHGYCHPLTIIDDHSRFSICLRACTNQRTNTVKTGLIEAFERYGLPLRMTMDNGSPWGSGAHPGRLTQLTAWLIELGIGVSHSRPYHPQTQGKDERFHKTLKAELLGRRAFSDVAHCQRLFDPWRERYNTRRPHESLKLDTPAEHYEVSRLSYPSKLLPYEYAPGDHIRKVGIGMTCSFNRYQIFIGKALIGKQVALRPAKEDGVYTVHYCHQKIAKVDLKIMTKRASS